MTRLKLGMVALWLICTIPFMVKSQQKENKLPAWQPGNFDIHFIETGRGNASFMVFPDGTTMLVDAGDLQAEEFSKRNAPLKVSPALPNDKKRPGEWICNYITQVMPMGRRPTIDYALITHYHEDHYGSVNDKTPFALNAAYQLSGIADVGTLIPIHKLLDRGFDFPVDLKTYYQNNRTFSNYVKFIDAQEKREDFIHETLKAGSSSQVSLLFQPKTYPNFAVRNIKTANKVWTGTGESYLSCFPDNSMSKNGFNENPLSNAIKITYGSFSYYTGGDNTGYEGAAFPGLKNVEAAIAKAVGKVSAMSLNHHGNRDANNNDFINALAPDVVIQQSWCSDQPGQELAFKLIGKNTKGDSIKVFNTHMLPESQTYLGAWITQAFKSLNGHVVIRVLNGGKTYMVYVLDESREKLTVLKTFGPYLSK
ncbi:hypothetical protein ACS5PU_18985 [Pedobacter sp. GSP4]|uniref:hypothetical protein n=1 Tax=Pedobacter sp. GSP4 TaxID=3453716 RepID=UPI003EE9F6E1